MGIFERYTTKGERDQAIQRLERLEKLFDSAFAIPGTGIRFGLDNLIGLVPVVGDGAMAACGMFIVYESWKLGVPTRTLALMAVNVAADMLVGEVPVVGDIADVFFKANRINVQMALKHLHGHRKKV